jgi:hypothetical protein
MVVAAASWLTFLVLPMPDFRLLSRFVPVRGLVILRQTFVSRSHRDSWLRRRVKG